MKLYLRTNDAEQFKEIDWAISCVESKIRPRVDYIRIDYMGDKYEYELRLLPESGYTYLVTV